MSLVITSNVGLKDKPMMSDIHKAYSYSNRLTDTIKIEKDSEIAVQSVKINKNGLYSVNKSNSNFALWFGRELTAVLNRDATGSQAVVGSIVETRSFEELSTDDLAVKISQGMANTICHPHYITRVTSTTEPPDASIVCSPNMGAGGEFEGYDIAFTQNVAVSDEKPNEDDTLDATGFLENDYDGNPPLWTYASATDRFTSTNPDNQANYGGAGVWLHDYPLALNNIAPNDRSFECDISNCNTQSGWCVGLGRFEDSQISPLNNGFKAYAPPYWDNFAAPTTHFGVRDVKWTHPNQHYEYVVCRIGNFLRVFHSVINSARNGAINHGSPWNVFMKEIRYWEVAGSHLAGAGPYNMNTNPNAYSKIGWSIDNTAVEPWVYTAMGGWAKIIDLTLAATTKRFQTKLRGTINNVLYGKIWVRQQNEYITIDVRRKVTAMDEWKNGNPRTDYCRHLIDNGTYTTWGRELETRNIYDYSPINLAEPTFTRVDANAVFQDFKPILITAPSDPYLREMTQFCNAQFIMGFKGRSLQDQPVASGPNNTIYTFTSTSIPQLTSPKSLFVKLSNFTHQTANGQQGQTASKLLAHLPRFDSAGNEVGGLYFEPHERVYVSLDNANDLFMNTFDVEICYDNEEVALCLSGKTIVCFHIRRKLFSELKD